MPPRLRKHEITDLCRVKPGARVRLKDFDPGWMGTPELEALGKDELKDRARQFLDRNILELGAAQERLWASDRYSILIVLQAMDAAGKDGTIKHVMSGLNPQGCAVHSFKRPSDEELDHNFLWRYTKRLPERGQIVVFNRSYYEDVLVTKVHPELLDRAKLPEGKRGDAFWRGRYQDINNLERHLSRNGTIIIKFFLHISEEEQLRRFMQRLENPEKHWKFSTSDLKERQHWDDYMRAFEEAFENTSTKWAPWWIIPADHKFVARALVASTITDAIASLGLQFPEVSEDHRRLLAEARRQLEGEMGGPRSKSSRRDRRPR